MPWVVGQWGCMSSPSTPRSYRNLLKSWVNHFGYCTFLRSTTINTGPPKVSSMMDRMSTNALSTISKTAYVTRRYWLVIRIHGIVWLWVRQVLALHAKGFHHTALEQHCGKWNINMWNEYKTKIQLVKGIFQNTYCDKIPNPTLSLKRPQPSKVFKFSLNFLHRGSKSVFKKQGKSEGFDSCDLPNNLTQKCIKSLIFQAVWSRN